MVKRIVAALILVVVLLVGYWQYLRYRSNALLRNGDVTVGEVRDSDGNEAHATPSRSDTPGTINTVPVNASAASKGVNAGTQSASLSQLDPQPAPAANSGGVPTTDSQAPNAPNGMAFTGNGKFQVYRQGNLTWRINTDDGSTCILFATNEEWRKPLVYSRGCPNG